MMCARSRWGRPRKIHTLRGRTVRQEPSMAGAADMTYCRSGEREGTFGGCAQRSGAHSRAQAGSSWSVAEIPSRRQEHLCTDEAMNPAFIQIKPRCGNPRLTAARCRNSGGVLFLLIGLFSLLRLVVPNGRTGRGTGNGVAAPDFVTGHGADRGALSGTGRLLIIGMGGRAKQQGGAEQRGKKRGTHWDSPVTVGPVQRPKPAVVASHTA